MAKYGERLSNKFSYDKIARMYRNSENSQNTVKLSLLKKITSVSDKDKNRRGSAGEGNRRKVILIHPQKGEKIKVNLFQLSKE